MTIFIRKGIYWSDEVFYAVRMFLSCYCWCDCERFLVDVLLDVLHAVRCFPFFFYFSPSLLFSARIIVVIFQTSVTGIFGEIDTSGSSSTPWVSDQYVTSS